MKTRPTPSRPASKTPVVRSAAEARREVAALRRGRDRLESAPRVDETSSRTAIAARRQPSP